MRVTTSIFYISILLAIVLDHSVSATLDQADEVDTTINLSDHYNTVNGGKKTRALKKSKVTKTTKALAENCPSDVISITDLEAVLGSVVISKSNPNTQSDVDVEILGLWCILSVAQASVVCVGSGLCLGGCLGTGALFPVCALACTAKGGPACALAVAASIKACKSDE